LEGGNFYGSQISFAADQLQFCISKLSIWQERIIQFLLNSSNHQLPLLLSPDVGKYMGLGGLGILSSSLTAQIRQKSFPASLGSIPTNADNQDIVPMGSISVLRNRETILLLEKNTACLLRTIYEAGNYMRTVRNSKLDQNIQEYFFKDIQYLSEDKDLTLELVEIETKIQNYFYNQYIFHDYFKSSYLKS
jgi:histidine ammonia-lyase